MTKKEMKRRNIMLIMTIVGLLALAAAGFMPVAATDPAPQTVDDVKLFNVADGDLAYPATTLIKVFPNDYGVVDVYFTAALSETGSTLLTLKHSPDGTNGWVPYPSGVYTFTAATAPAFQHARVAVYGQALGFALTIDGEDTTPTIYVVGKDNAGQ